MKKSRLNLGFSPGTAAAVASWEKKELCEVYEQSMGKTLKREDQTESLRPSRDQAIRLLAGLK